MRVLLLSAYDAESHRYWHKGLTSNFPEFEWRVLTLPPRFFAWRIRGNGLYWSQANQKDLTKPYDLLIATSMVDLATLRGLCPSLAKIPSIVYFHENQLVYPLSGKQKSSIEPAMVNVYSALAADVCLFNSEFNRASFDAGLKNLLKQFPDYVPPNIAESIQLKSKVLPVPLHKDLFDRKRANKADKAVSIVWNHRWEYDKGPELLLKIVEKLPAGLALTFHVVGQSFKNIPPPFEQIHSLLKQKHYCGEFGFIESRAEYFDLLNRCDFVLSTAQHDFQGLSVLEAIACGCIPVVPSRLAYPEYVPAKYCYGAEGQAPQGEHNAGKQSLESEAEQAVAKILNLVNLTANSRLEPLSVHDYSWASLKKSYLEIFEQAAREARP